MSIIEKAGKSDFQSFLNIGVEVTEAKRQSFYYKFAFEKLNAHKVVGMCNSNNTRSATSMECIGMTRGAIF